MPRKKKRKWNYKHVIASLVVLASIVLAIVYGMGGFAEFATTTPECSIARPYFGSINCVRDSIQQKISVVAKTPLSIGKDYDTYDVTGLDFLSLGDTSNPESYVGGCASTEGNYIILIDRNLATGVEQEIVVCGMNLGTPSLDDCERGEGHGFPGIEGITFKSGHSYTLRARCTGVWSHWSPNEDDFIVRYGYYGEEFKLNIDSASNVPIDGTRGCKKDDLWNKYYSLGQKQVDRTTLNKITTSISNGFMGMIPFQPSTGDGLGNVPPSSYVVDMPLDSYAGQAYWLMYTWVEAPYLIVTKYAGQDVYCDITSHQLVAFDTINTVGDSCYRIPTRAVAQVQCCSTDECRVWYNDPTYVCDIRGDSPTYTCKKEGVPCDTDYDCGIQDSCRYENGKYIVTGHKCVENSMSSARGFCETFSKNSDAKCCKKGTGGPECPGDQYCEYGTGCVSLIKTCPEGACCLTNKEYTYRECDEGLTCCETANPNIGWCKDKCVNGEECEIWDLPCILRGALNIKLPSAPSLNVAAMGALTGLALFALAGFLIAGPIGALIGAVVGALIGFGVAGILEALKPFVTIVGAILVMPFSHDFLKEKLKKTDKNLLIAIAVTLGIIAGILIWISYWFGVAILLAYLILIIIKKVAM